MAVVVKNPPTNAGDTRDMGSIPGSGRSPGGGHGNLPQYSCLENPMDRGAWRAIVHRVIKSQTRLKWLSTHTCIMTPYFCTGIHSTRIWRVLPSCVSPSVMSDSLPGPVLCPRILYLNSTAGSQMGKMDVWLNKSSTSELGKHSPCARPMPLFVWPTS